MKRGDIYWANLKPRSGSEQQGKRPVVIVSHNAFNLTPLWRSIIIIPLSTSIRQAKRGPTAIPILSELTELKKDSVALCHQITTLDRSKLANLISSLAPKQMEQVEMGIKAALDIK